MHKATNPARVMAKARPGALPIPGDRSVAALTKADVFDRWNVDAAGIRPAALAMNDNVITMFDVIGEDWWTGGGITAKGVAAALRAIGDRPVEVQINSPGGDMFEGIAIYNVLREHSQAITIKIMGMAASAASVIAMAGDTIEIGAASFIMIHNTREPPSKRQKMAEFRHFLGLRPLFLWLVRGTARDAEIRRNPPKLNSARRGRCARSYA